MAKAVPRVQIPHDPPPIMIKPSQFPAQVSQIDPKAEFIVFRNETYATPGYDKHDPTEIEHKLSAQTFSNKESIEAFLLANADKLNTFIVYQNKPLILTKTVTIKITQ